jgi:hypothetical protein
MYLHVLFQPRLHYTTFFTLVAFKHTVFLMAGLNMVF